jgi:transcriptional regulator with XRE-family HTH domain
MKPEQFKGRRLALGLTQDTLGAFLNISTRQVRRYENSETVVPGPLAILIDILTTRKIPKTSLIDKKI